MTRELRRALLVGLNTYEHFTPLTGAAADAEALAELLGRHSDGSPNYHCTLFADMTDDGQHVRHSLLWNALEKLFRNHREDVLFYFSGHGVQTETDMFMCTWEAEIGHYGVSLSQVMTLVNTSPARSVLLVLDCCDSGGAANLATGGTSALPIAMLREDVTVIAASRSHESAWEVGGGGHGVFTSAVLDALRGGAADHMGWITASSIYSYAERRFGAQDQRPVFKSHATHSHVIRECAPLIDRLDLHQLTEHFPTSGFRFVLDPEFEPEDEHGVCHEPVNEGKVELAKLFKRYRDAGLLRPTNQVEQLYWTARHGHTVSLTARGREYWELVKSGRI